MSLERLIAKYEFLTKKLAQNPLQQVVQKVQQVTPKLDMSPQAVEKRQKALEPFDLNKKIEEAAPAIAKGLGFDMSPEAVAERQKKSDEWMAKQRTRANELAQKVRPYMPGADTLMKWQEERERKWREKEEEERKKRETPIDIGDIDAIQAPAQAPVKAFVIEFERFLKNAEAPQTQQADLGTGETQAIVAAAGTQIKNIITKLDEIEAQKDAAKKDAAKKAGKPIPNTPPASLTDETKQISFTGTVNAPNFKAASVDLESVELIAGYDEPIASMATQASEAIMKTLKPAIESALLKFYKTPAGVSILKISGTPPNFKVVIKWKLK